MMSHNLMCHHLFSVSFKNTVNQQDSIMLTLHYTLTASSQTFYVMYVSSPSISGQVLNTSVSFTNHTKDSHWETLAQRRMITHFCKLFKAYSGECDRLRRPYYLSRAIMFGKLRDRMQRTDIRKYSFVNKTIKNWN